MAEPTSDAALDATDQVQSIFESEESREYGNSTSTNRSDERENFIGTL